jgi:stress-induced-phosphoprotein 1
VLHRGHQASSVRPFSACPEPALTCRRSDPRAYNNRAAAYTKLVALPEALKDAEEAIKIDPSFVKAYIRKSMVLYGMKEYNKALAACQDALEADSEKKHTREIETQMQKCMMETYAQRSNETDEQTLARAMQDPEIASIMVCPIIVLVECELTIRHQSDPVMQSLLQQAQSDPRALQDHMKNPMIKQKIQKVSSSECQRVWHV